MRISINMLRKDMHYFRIVKETNTRIHSWTVFGVIPDKT